MAAPRAPGPIVSAVEFRANRLFSILFVAAGLMAAGLGFWALRQPGAPLVGQMFGYICVLGGPVLAAIMAFRAVAGPVMLRVSEEGLYIRRLDGIILPWPTIERLRIADHESEGLIEIIPASPLPDIYKSGAIYKGAIANGFVNLPPYCLNMSGYQGTTSMFLAAASAYVTVDR